MILFSGLFILTRNESGIDTAKTDKSGFLLNPNLELIWRESASPSKSITGKLLRAFSINAGLFKSSLCANSFSLARSFHFLTKWVLMVVESLASNHACRLSSSPGDQTGGSLKYGWDGSNVTICFHLWVRYPSTFCLSSSKRTLLKAINSPISHEEYPENVPLPPN